MRNSRGITALLALCFLATASVSAQPIEVQLAADGRAQMPVIVGPNASESVAKAARELADYLGQISGARFAVRFGDGASGIVVGLAEDFDALPFEVDFGDGPFDREAYRLVSGESSLHLIGATPLAVEFAIWDLLYRLGHRQFFPTATWEVVPSLEQITIAIDELQRPSYYNRSGPRGSMRVHQRPWSLDLWRQWRVRNRTAQAFVLHTGHAYLGLIRANMDHFEANPEFYAKVNGERRFMGSDTKLCIGNEELRRFVVGWAIERIEATPDADSISMDPSDGGGWCECELCAQTGTVSDRVVLLANDVAQGLEEHFGRPIYVGIYAYSHHSLPPNIDVHPNVIVSLATAFIRGDQTIEDMLEGWGAKVQLMGMREFYGLSVWNSMQPGRARAANPSYMIESIAKFYEAGARFMNAESDDSWGPNGLGYYLAARLLWDVNEAKRGQELIDDFLDKSFGPAREPMAAFYDLITAPPTPLLSENLVARMYRLLGEARELAADHPEVVARIDDLILYTRYVELDRVYSAARGPERQQPLDELMEFAWRIRDRMMPESMGLLSYLNRTVRATDELDWGEGYTALTPPTRLRQRENEPVSESELLSILQAGIANNQPLEFEPVAFSDELMPSDALRLQGPALNRPVRTRGRYETYTWMDRPARAIRLEIATGLIYDNRGPARVALESWNEDHADYEPVDTAEVPSDRKAHVVVLTSPAAGRHRIVIEERMAGTEVTWPGWLRRTWPSSMTNTNTFIGRDNGYFYVPRGTQIVGAYVTARGGRVLDADGEQVISFEGQTFNDFVALPVPPGQDGRLWSYRALAGTMQLMTVPAYVAGSAEDLLLPAEVIREDAGR